MVPGRDLWTRCRDSQVLVDLAEPPLPGTSQDSMPDLGTSFTRREVWNRPDLVGASHGTFHEGRPARLTSHHPGCSVRVNGAGGGMKINDL